MKTPSYNPYRGVAPKEDATIESFAKYRDNLHKNFRFTKANLARLMAFGIVVPFFVWTTTQMYLVCGIIIGFTHSFRHEIGNNIVE
jgi:hypothetical protein